MLVSLIRKGAQEALDLLAPVRCPLCGAKLGREELCPACRFPDRRLVVREIRCDRFGAFLVLAGGRFEGPLRQVVHAFKYDQHPGGLRLLAVQTALAVPGGMQWDGLVPVPAHRVRLRERGWEPVRDLTGALSALLGLPLESKLRRRWYTETLTGKKRLQRRQIVEGAFEAASAEGCLLLVDDVNTTGATLRACRRVLLDAGARSVDLLVAARTPRRVGAPGLRRD
jgi:predicted amidophosphoribosyltransferase